MSLNRRLAQLESLVTVWSATDEGEQDRAATLLEQRIARDTSDIAAATVLLNTMPPHWREVVMCDHQQHGRYDLTSNLSRQFELLVARVFYGTLSGPLALPERICEILYNRPDTILAVDCAGCGQWHPVRRPPSNALILSRCVVCGDQVGQAAYYNRHGSWSAAPVLPADLVAEARAIVTTQLRSKTGAPDVSI